MSTKKKSGILNNAGRLTRLIEKEDRPMTARTVRRLAKKLRPETQVEFADLIDASVARARGEKISSESTADFLKKIEEARRR